MGQFEEFLEVDKKEFQNVTDLQIQMKTAYKLMNQPGLGKVCQIYLEKGLDKMETCSDWSARPLRKA